MRLTFRCDRFKRPLTFVGSYGITLIICESFGLFSEDWFNHIDTFTCCLIRALVRTAEQLC